MNDYLVETLDTHGGIQKIYKFEMAMVQVLFVMMALMVGHIKRMDPTDGRLLLWMKIKALSESLC